MTISRRNAVKAIGAASAAVDRWIGRADAAAAPPRAEFEVTVGAVGDRIVRVTVGPLVDGKPLPVPVDGSLILAPGDAPPAFRSVISPLKAHSFACGKATVAISSADDVLTVAIEADGGKVAQTLTIYLATMATSFPLGDGPVFGLGEGGPQFDRRGSVYPNRSGQGGYRLKTHGGRVPIPWLVGSAGWALFFHHPHGGFDLTGPSGKFITPGIPTPSSPLDVFVVVADRPAEVMASYAKLTGFPELPPLWSLGYQQSHRTLASADEILDEARTFREKKLPCDAMIYLGTGFCPSGWNTGHGSWDYNPRVFAEPEKVVGELRAMHFKVIPHVVIRAREVKGSVGDPFDPKVVDESSAASYWNAHRQVIALSDGWWPDEGDPLDAASRLNRIRMYHDGEHVDRPDARPFALHRNGYAGMQRYAPFLWSGDVYSTWETLKVHLPIAVNVGLSGIPLWGTDIGGFVPTKEFTGELYVRWFQFGAFCPSFRAHGRTWKLRLPWGWNTGEIGPDEIRSYGEAANPGPEELHNAEVEPICRTYLDLRYRLLPYLYSAIREGHDTGLPIIRALWLHHPDDPAASTRGDEFLWGRDLLVAPVVEKGATSRSVYLPRGTWYDFWTDEKVEGGREIARSVNLATTPIYARAGAIVPLGPVKQYTAEPSAEPIALTIYPGASGTATLYDDDGASFAYRSGDFAKIRMTWDDARKVLGLELAGGKMRATTPRDFTARVAPGRQARPVRFDGNRVEVAF